MPKLSAILLFLLISSIIHAQDDKKEVMGKRASEFQRVIGLSESAAWKKYITDNFSESLINKTMQARKEETQDGNTTSTTTPDSAESPLDQKIMMFKMLHLDFGDAKLLSTNVESESVTLVMENESGLTGTFTLKFGKVKPWLIEGLGIQAQN